MQALRKNRKHRRGAMENNRTLDSIKIGDIVAPVRVKIRGERGEWTGVLHSVTRVTPKRFYIGTGAYEKSTGRQVGFHGSSYSYVIATPEMIAEYEAKAKKHRDDEAALEAFHARQEYQDASAIYWALSEMKPDHNPLDLLTTAEWSELRKKLKA
jgi:hypothetical protein